MAEIKAKEGQYFCEVAAEKGFPDCSQFREINPDLADKAVLDEGDVVTIPEPKPKTTSGETENKHSFVRVNCPPATVRIIGEKQVPNRREGATMARIGVSNYITNKAQGTVDANTQTI
ncbi:MAG: hypothetical protein IID36_13930, partial [Planctomycetes bacterium]|nr:hypothetical protein [Planctomycetota bacterium]